MRILVFISISISISLAACVSNSVKDTEWVRDGQSVSSGELSSIKKECGYESKYKHAASLRGTSLSGGRYNSSNSLVTSDEYIQEATKIIKEVKDCMNNNGLSRNATT